MITPMTGLIALRYFRKNVGHVSTELNFGSAFQLLCDVCIQVTELNIPFNKTDFDNQRIAKGVSVKVAHKIGDADEFKHDTGVVYADSPFILSIFTKNSDYDTISQIAKDVYEVLK